MKEISFEHPHRRAHFEYFNRMTNPLFAVCAPVEVTAFVQHRQERRLPFTPAVVYLVARAANDIPEFRWRIRGERVVEHGVVHPSFSVPTDRADVFSFCEVPYAPDGVDFIHRAQTRMAQMRVQPSFTDEPGRDDFLFLSAFPWASFTSVQHPMHYQPCDSVPRIVWGKHYPEGDKILMPVSVQAHHAVVDGRHCGYFFEQLSALFAEPGRYFGKLL